MKVEFGSTKQYFIGNFDRKPYFATQKSISTTLFKLGILHTAGKPWPQKTRFRIILSIFLKCAFSTAHSPQLWDGCSIRIVHMWYWKKCWSTLPEARIPSQPRLASICFSVSLNPLHSMPGIVLGCQDNKITVLSMGFDDSEDGRSLRQLLSELAFIECYRIANAAILLLRCYCNAASHNAAAILLQCCHS